MKTKIILISFFLTSSIYSFTQDFIPGFYIINSTAEYSVGIPSGLDFYYDEYGLIQKHESLLMNAGEVVLAYDFSKEKYYCFDPNGRLVVFQGINCLTKVSSGLGIGKLNETIELVQGGNLLAGSFYWIEEQNIANSTIKIRVADGKTFDIPQGNVTLWSKHIKDVMKDQYYQKVEE